MIANHGYTTLPTAKIKAPGDIEKLRREQHTLDLAASLASTGGRPLDPIILEWGTWRLLGGRHRFAAALNAKLKDVEVILLEGTPEELEQACLVEQIRRRRATDSEIARLVELSHPTPAQTFPDVEEEESNTLLPPTTKRAAIAKIAKATGRTEAAVKQADHRARHKWDEEPDAPDSCIDTMGLKGTAEVHADAWSETAFLESAEKTLVKLQGDCSRHMVQHPQLRNAIHDAAAIARSLTPASVCPHCKLTSLQRACLACRGRGWLRAGEMANVPVALLTTGADAGVYVGGKWTLIGKVK
jgi:hypothetical protein